MAGALSTLGLGSQGVLTNDIIDQLKEADKTAVLDPINRNLANVNAQQKSLKEMKTLLSDLSDVATNLSDISLYQTKSSTLIGDSITVDASSSAKEQSFEIDVISLATRDIKQSTSFASKTDTLSAGTMHLEIDGNNFDIAIDDTDTLETLAKKIDESTDGKISASILNVGGDDPYKLILKSTDTGSKNNITVSGDIAFTQVGDGAKDASLTIDGIAVTKSSNEISDLIDGTTITLNKEGKTSVTISQDSEKVLEEMNKFVEQYNGLLSKIDTYTNYDAETKTAGVFQSSSEIRDIKSTLNEIFDNAMLATGKSTEEFGLTVERGGTLKLDEDKFKETLGVDSKSVTDFFVSDGEDIGLFKELSSSLFSMSTSSDGLVKTLSDNYSDRIKSLEESYKKAQERLDNKYEIMQKKFAAYDKVIGKLSSQSSMLTSMIDAQFADK